MTKFLIHKFIPRDAKQNAKDRQRYGVLSGIVGILCNLLLCVLGGDRSHANEVVEYLKNQQVDTIDYMISSHYDEDHLGGLVKCLDNFEVEHILGSDYVHTSELFNTFMNTATANGLSVEYPSVGDTYEFGTGSFTVMAPSGISKNSNDNSVVIRLVNGNNGFLFMGDAEETSEQDMISTGKSLDCDVLCLGHHGSASSTSWDLLEACTHKELSAFYH